MKELYKHLESVVSHKDKYMTEKNPIDRLKITLGIAKCTEVILYDLANRLEGVDSEYSLEEIEKVRTILSETATVISSKKFFIPNTNTVH